MKGVNGFICQRIETGARLLETRELNFGCHKNWKTYCLAEKLLHSQEWILTSRGTYWHTNLFRIKDILDHSVTIHYIIWVTFVKLFNSLFYYMINYLFMLVFYSFLYMLICFRTLQMERLELNIPLISACLQDQECPRSMCQPITV
jgi:hypothetical protein